MWAMYREGFAAQDVGAWLSNWEQTRVDMEQTIRSYQFHYTRHVLERYLTPGSLALEGGCGTGNIVLYFRRRGVRMVGLDFGYASAVPAKGVDPQAPFLGGNVEQLPFASDTFDAYFSGGVVEHFILSSEPALREAFRVLKPGGHFLISVPQMNALRTARAWWSRLQGKSAFPLRYGGKWPIMVGRCRGPAAESYDGIPFYAYLYSPREFAGWLRRVGFDIVEHHGASILFGLNELTAVRRLMAARSERAGGQDRRGARASVERSDGGSPSGSASEFSGIKRLLVQELSRSRAERIAIRAAQRSFGNMMLFACRKPTRVVMTRSQPGRAA